MPKGIELSVWRYSASNQQAYLGVLAQQVQRVRPDCVGLSPTGRLTVNHSKLFGTGFEVGRGSAMKDSMKVQSTLRNALGP
ncbi:hypothetical protein I6F15_04490 [Bradyrhizobium sp. BRP14]|nr:hypothetical protein [Bradyrhizobium sp. BRP14]